jgi:hypothetical protein
MASATPDRPLSWCIWTPGLFHSRAGLCGADQEAWFEAWQRADGSSVEQTDDGRVAFIPIRSRALSVVALQAGTLDIPPGQTDLFVDSCAAGRKASHSYENNQTTAIIRPACA